MLTAFVRSGWTSQSAAGSTDLGHPAEIATLAHGPMQREAHPDGGSYSQVSRVTKSRSANVPITHFTSAHNVVKAARRYTSSTTWFRGARYTPGNWYHSTSSSLCKCPSKCKFDTATALLSRPVLFTHFIRRMRYPVSPSLASWPVAMYAPPLLEW